MPARTKILLGFLVAALAASARVIPGPRTIDDAFITFRYARNLLAGEGPVFNPGERVLGTTTPLYMGVLAVFALPSGGAAAPFPEIALLINVLADALTCLLLIRIGSALRAEAAGWAAALLWAVSPMSVTFAVGGLETSVYILLLVSVLYFRLRGNMPAVSVLAGLAFLTRPDALILIAPVWGELFFSACRRYGVRAGTIRILRFSVPLLVILLGWSAFAAAYYGTLLPHSLLAKSVAYRLAPTAGFIRLIQHYATPFFEQDTFGVWVPAVTGPLYLFLSLLGIWSAEKRNPGAGAAACLSFPWLYFVVFSAANPLIFRWYLAPPLPFLFLSVFLGVSALLGFFRSSEGASLRIRRAVFGALAAGALILSLREWTLSPGSGPSRPAPEMAYVGLETLYRQAAQDLQARVRPGYTVAAADVGTLGYYLDARILDLVGLNSAESVRYYPLPESMYVILYAVPPDLIITYRPEVVIILEVYGRNGLLRDPRFLDEYRQCDEYPTDIYGSRGLLVFCRKDVL
jgi:arabinofuranosyltransferase